MRNKEAHSHVDEETFIQRFIKPEKRERYQGLLSPSRRAKLRFVLDHCRDFDDRYSTEVTAKALEQFVTRCGGANPCRLMSSDLSLDGACVSIRSAVQEISASQAGTVAIIEPACLAFYVGEAGEKRLIFTRDKLL